MASHCELVSGAIPISMLNGKKAQNQAKLNKADIHITYGEVRERDYTCSSRGEKKYLEGKKLCGVLE